MKQAKEETKDNNVVDI